MNTTEPLGDDPADDLWVKVAQGKATSDEVISHAKELVRKHGPSEIQQAEDEWARKKAEREHEKLVKQVEHTLYALTNRDRPPVETR